MREAFCTPVGPFYVSSEDTNEGESRDGETWDEKKKDGKKTKKGYQNAHTLSVASPKLPKLGTLPCDWYEDGGGRPPLEAGWGIGEGEVWGEVTRGFMFEATPRPD